MNIADMVRETNRIEGILRPPTPEEIEEHRRFVNLEELTLTEFVRFVGVYQPDARIRDTVGLNVYVGDHVPPPGGLHIPQLLQDLVDRCNAGKVSPWAAHVEYETLHPFTDGNGRSGRALWYNLMRANRMVGLGFLHAFYYQTLSSVRLQDQPGESR